VMDLLSIRALSRLPRPPAMTLSVPQVLNRMEIGWLWLTYRLLRWHSPSRKISSEAATQANR